MRFRIMKIATSFLSALALVVIVMSSGCQHESTNCQSVRLTDTTLRIPKRYLVDTEGFLVSSSKHRFDQLSDILLKIPLDDLVHRSAENVPLATMSTYVRLVAVGMRPSVNTDAIDAWMQRGLYQRRVVETESDPRLIRIYSQDGYPALWNYFRDLPPARPTEAEALEMWIASCRVSPQTGNNSVDLPSCLTTVQWKSLQVEIHFPGNVVSDIELLVSGLRDLLDSWSADACG